VDSVYKTGEYTIVIKTKEPYAPAISSFADPVMSIVSPKAENLDTKPVGTGHLCLFHLNLEPVWIL